MPKRKTEEEIRNYKEKIKKFKDNRRRWARIVYSSSSSENEDDENEQNGDCSPAVHEPAIPHSQFDSDITAPNHLSDVPTPEHFGDEPTPELINEPPVAENQTTTSNQPELDPNMLLALGESTDDTPEFGDNIHDNLAKLWLPILKKGMLKETKDKLQKEYLVPDNCRLLQAPKLNVEIAAAVHDTARNRDKNLTALQQQLGSGISAINRAMDILIKGADADQIQATKHLSNGCRLLCDLHASYTQCRIKLLMPILEKTVLQVIQETERDETVFGNKLSEKIKAAKAIEKHGLQIRKAPPKNITSAQPVNYRATHSGNWSAPPRYTSNRGGRRGARSRATTGNYNRRTFHAPQTARTSTTMKTRAQAP